MSSSPSTDQSDRLLARAELVIVGAGIVGLAHAVHAVAQGRSVVVIERDARAVGASIRNFGHGGVTAQAGTALRYARAARPLWIRLAREAGFWLRESGAVVVARADDELAVLTDFQADRGDDVVLLDAAAVARRVPVGPGVIGGAWLRPDIRVDARTAIPALAAWLATQGVEFHWSTMMTAIEDGRVRTSRGSIEAERVVVAVGHDVDRHFPMLASEVGLRRCLLHMLRVANSGGASVDPAVLSGFSLLRYEGFAVSPALAGLRARLAARHPAAIAAGLNLMYTQRPDGDLIVGDTHEYVETAAPFQDEERDDLVGRYAAELLGRREIEVRERWQGVYASASEPFLIAAPTPSVRVVSVTSGVGMTAALGLAGEVVAELF